MRFTAARVRAEIEHLSVDLRAEIVSLLPNARVFAREDETFSPAEFDAYGTDRTPEFAGSARYPLLVQPSGTADVAALVRFARARGLALVPSGGRTGLSGGAVAADGEIVVSLARMDRLLEFNPWLPALRVEAGMIVARLQAEASERGFFYPVDFGASGSACVGGTIATNAGGIRVIRYGSTREQVIGLTVVTGTGDILECPGDLLKNNTGYDLKQILIGSEGTLGIITEATLRLAQPPPACSLVVLGLDSIEAVVATLREVRAARIELFAFECFDAVCLDAVRAYLDLPAPFSEPYAWYVLIEMSAAQDHLFESLLSDCLFPDHVARDAQRAEGSAAVRRFWQYRESIGESLGGATAVHKYDISVPTGTIAAFARDLQNLLEREAPAVRPAFFGHAGDGNLHINLINSPELSREAFFSLCARVDPAVYALIAAHRGSVSAEHGIGLLKKSHLHRTRSAAEIALMRAIKNTFDPDGILNPGKVLPD